MINRDNLYDWLVNWLVSYLHVSKESINDHCAFSDLGVDSVGAVTLAGDLEAGLNCDLEDTLLWDYPTIKDLVNYLEENLAA